MILAEITAAVDDAGTTQTFYLASGSYRTEPSDTPASRNFISALSDPGSIGVSVYRSGRTGGYGSLEVGDLKIVNSDGRFDSWVNYGFDGRPLVLRLYRPDLPYAYMPVLFTGTVDGPPEVARQSIVLRLRDKQIVLEVPACPGIYAGTNIPPNGVDGLPTDLKGQRKPKCYGQVSNMTPDLVNTSLQVFRVNDGAVADIPAAYDRGEPFTKDSDYPDNVALQAATISAGHYATCFAEGLFRVNATLTGQITADVLEGAAASNRTAAQIIMRIALLAGLSALEISSADAIYLDAMQPAVVGIYLSGDTTAREAINQIAESIGAYAVFDTTGVLRMGRLSEPTGTPVLALDEGTILDLERQAQRDGDLPSYSVTLNHTPNWTIQDTDVAGAVDLDRRAFLKKAFRQAYTEAPSVRQKYLLSPPLVADSLIVDLDNLALGPADEEVKRLLALYKKRRDMLAVTIHQDTLRGQGPPSLMSIIQLNVSRPGVVPGSLFWLIGFTLELRRSQVELLLWG